MPVELFLSYDEHLDWLTLIEFGRVENAQLRDHWRRVSESFCYLLRHPEGPGVGSKILGFSGFDPEDPEVSQIWEGPRFDVPTPGLRNPTAGGPCRPLAPSSACAAPSTASTSTARWGRRRRGRDETDAPGAARQPAGQEPSEQVGRGDARRIVIGSRVRPRRTHCLEPRLDRNRIIVGGIRRVPRIII